MNKFVTTRPKYDFERQIVGDSLCKNPEIVREVVEHSGTTNLILQQIYAPDPVTRLPSSDIVCFLSSDTPQEVRLFIQQNLMSPVTAEKVGLASDMDSDTIAELTRGVDEDSHTYASRVSAYMQKHVDEVNRLKVEQEKQKLVE